MPSMLKDDDVECDSDGGSFEAVTPERHSESHEENEKTPITEKHRHILEDVDVELEMEDVAPSNEVETDHPYATQLNNVEASQNQIEQNLQYSFALQQSLEAASSLPPVTHPPEHPPLPPPVPCSVSASVIPDQNTDGVCLKVGPNHVCLSISNTCGCAHAVFLFSFLFHYLCKSKIIHVNFFLLV